MNDGRIYLSDVRISFPHLTEPQRTTNETTGVVRIAYGADFILPEDHPGFVAFMAQCTLLATEKWKGNADKVFASVENDRKLRCYGDGKTKVNSKSFEVYAGYDGNKYITTSRPTRPQVFDSSGAPLDPSDTMAYTELTTKMYGGCHVNVSIKPWLQDNKHGKGFRCELLGIQFLKDGTPFGGAAIDTSELFKPIPVSGNTGDPLG